MFPPRPPVPTHARQRRLARAYRITVEPGDEPNPFARLTAVPSTRGYGYNPPTSLGAWRFNSAPPVRRQSFLATFIERPHLWAPTSRPGHPRLDSPFVNGP